MSITTKEVPAESHNSICIVERYHAPLLRAYEIIRHELNDVPEDVVLQMAIKAVNDTAGPDGIVPTLLVFGAYPRLTNTDPPHPTTIQRAKAIRAAMKEVRRFYEKRQVTDALRMRNGPDVTSIHNLAVDSKVMVWREKEKWTRPYKYFGIDGESCSIEMPYGPTIFRSTVVKPYYSKDLEICEQDMDLNKESTNHQIRRYPVRQRVSTRKLGESECIQNMYKTSIFITAKENFDLELSKQLRSQGIIKIPGLPFELSRKQEIDGLIARGVFELIPWTNDFKMKITFFNSRFVDEIKRKRHGYPI